MYIEKIAIRNFRRLENVVTALEERETIFVGPNNSGKTSATVVFSCFLGHRKFSIHDFSVSKIADIDAFGFSGDSSVLPALELDIWFRVDPEGIEFGRAFALLPNLSDDFRSLGVRMSFQVSDLARLREEYLATYPAQREKPPEKPLSHYLAQDSNLTRFFAIEYASLDASDGEPVTTPLDQSEGKSLLQSLVRIDFVDAQRKIDDDDSHRSNRLSSAFAGFYKNNLEQAETASEAQKVIDTNNDNLTQHYATQFAGLMATIKGLGVPSINDRDLQIVSTLSAESALRGSTDLLYVDSARNHQLPELYNGLGFKNLIYMTIQAKHFHSQWLNTPVNRPLCHMIFIEEPEVHLHAQVQQIFIQNIWGVIKASAIAEGEPESVPQLVVTTHSSHVLDATEFAKIRYFRQCKLADDDDNSNILNATEIHSLRDFQPQAVHIGEQIATEKEALEFLKRYLRLTHCDLFFADAAILVEGAAEKLLLPQMIEKSAIRLRSSYLTVLEIGGAYAHRFDELLTFLNIPYLIITDLDSVSPDGRHSARMANVEGALTSNASLKQLLKVNTIADLISLSIADRTDEDRDRHIAFQQDILVTEGGSSYKMRARTFEEAIAHQNFALLRSSELDIGVPIPDSLKEAYEKIYTGIGTRSFKKVEFSMELLASNANWQTPNYIQQGLQWLETRLHGDSKDV